MITSMKRLWALFRARNLEFVRDKGTLVWNLILPLFLIFGFSVIFSASDKAQFKIGLLEQEVAGNDPFLQTPHIEFIYLQNTEHALSQIRKHQLDLLLDHRLHLYWLNDNSAKGELAERMLLALSPVAIEHGWQKQSVSGASIRYVDWVLPGILGMNMMFSCLFGVGYVIVRYRKTLVLKRLSATPVRPSEFIIAQLLSRLLIVLLSSAVVYVGCDWFLNFYMLGHYLDLLIITVLGILAFTSLGLLLASRSRSEELTGGLLNLVAWPMMVLSGVWYSLDNSPLWLQMAADWLPLTHVVGGARAIMLDGANLQAIMPHIEALGLMILVCLVLGAGLFRWQGDE